MTPPDYDSMHPLDMLEAIEILAAPPKVSSKLSFVVGLLTTGEQWEPFDNGIEADSRAVYRTKWNNAGQQFPQLDQNLFPEVWKIAEAMAEIRLDEYLESIEWFETHPADAFKDRYRDYPDTDWPQPSLAP